MAGLTNDEVARFKADLFKVERERPLDIKPSYPEIMKVVTGLKGAGDKYTQLLGPGRLTRHTVENQDINFKSPAQAWTSLVKYDRYSAGLVFSKEAVVDNMKLGNVLTDLAEQWVDYGLIAKEELCARYFNHGGDTSGDWLFLGTFLDETDSSGLLPYDSAPMFNLTGNKRTTKGGGTFYSSVASLTMNADDFETLYNLATATNNRGEENEVKRNPVNTILCLPGSDKFKAERIVNTTREAGLPGTQLNDLNPYYGIVDKIIDFDYLDSDGGFFVGRRQDERIEFRERQSQETDFFRDHTNKSYKASVDMRFKIFVKPLAWRAWVRGGGNSNAGGATE